MSKIGLDLLRKYIATLAQDYVQVENVYPHTCDYTLV